MNAPEPGIFHGISSEDYHRGPGFSSSGARTLTSKTPAHFRHQQTHPTYSDAFDMGTAAHSVILENDYTGILEVDAPNWLTKAAKEAKSEARAAGLVPLLSKDLRAVEAMHASVLAHDRARTILQGGKAEQSVYWHHETGTLLKARPDKFNPDSALGPLIVDLKTTISADPEKFSKSVADYGYHQQQAWYEDGLKAHGFDAKFVFVLVEKAPPYLVNVVELDPYAVELGRFANDKAIRLYNECTTNDHWPGYPVAEPVHLPLWAERQAEEDYEGMVA
ncbi:recE [Arthrobacter frigidicola]|nr:recE [Arthrobacter frigidicola]